jgi:predicted permease
VGAGLLLRSFAKLTGVEPGFDPRGVVASQVRLPESAYPDDASRRRLFDELLRRVRVLPGVADAAVGSDLPLSSGWQSTMTFEGLPFERGAAPMFNGAVVSDGYFRTVRMRLLAGRALAPTDGERAPPVAVVSARVARQMFGARDPIGRRLRQGFGDSQEPWRTIVGVVDDVRNDGLAVASRGTIYYPAGQMGSASMWLVVRAGGAMAGTPERLVPALRRELAALDRAVPLAETQTLEEALARSVSQPRFSMLMLAVFASSALLLAAVGLYGVVATSAAQRRREIGVRIALGARRGAVVRSVVWQSVRLVAAGAVIGGAAAWGGGRVLASLLYEVRPTDPPVFAGVVLLLVGVAVAAALVPAARAARIDPAAVMRDG